MPIPAVSVCVAGSRAGQALGETVRSVLDQTYRDFELIVVGDPSIEVARTFRDPRVQLERAPVGQGADGRNLAVQRAIGSLVKVLRPRDLLHPRCLQLQVDAIDSDPGVAVVASRWHVVDEKSRVRLPQRGLGRLTGLHSEAEVGRKVLADGAGSIGAASTMLFRRDAFFSAGRWRNEHPAVIDLELCLRMLRHGDFLGLPEPLAALRIDPAEDVADGLEQRRAFLDELAEAGTYRRPRFGAPVAALRRAGRGFLGTLAGVPRTVT